MGAATQAGIRQGNRLPSRWRRRTSGIVVPAWLVPFPSSVRCWDCLSLRRVPQPLATLSPLLAADSEFGSDPMYWKERAVASSFNLPCGRAAAWSN
jgi:hypothetical protein